VSLLTPRPYKIDLQTIIPMDYVNATIDRIHYLVEQSSFLSKNGFEYEAKLLIAEAKEHARELRQLNA